MPHIDGIALLDGLSARGCRIPHMALMSAYWTPKTLAHADEQGYKVFEKPAGIWQIDHWLTQCIDHTPPTAPLANHFGPFDV